MSRTGKRSSWLLGRVRKGQVWCALLSLSLGLSVATAVQESWYSPGNEQFRLQDRSIDPSLADGFKPPTEDLSVGLFSLSLAASFVAIFLALSLFNGWVERRLESGAVAGERSGLLLLSQMSLGLYCLHLIVGNVVPESMRDGLHLLASLLLGSMLVKHLVAVRLPKSREWAGVWGMLSDNQLMLSGLFFPVALIALFDGLSGGEIQPLGFLSGVGGFVDYLVVLILLITVYALVLRRRTIVDRVGSALTLYDLNTAVIVTGAPLVLIPLGLQIANEIQYTIGGLESRWPFVICVGLLVGVSLVLYGMQRRGKVRLAGTRVVEGFYFPVAVATLASFKFHRHVLHLGELDYFQSGEQVLPAQQWSDFGSFPLLDLIPTHGLSDVGVQSLYTLLNGVQGLDMLVWLPWIPAVVGLLAIYGLLAVVASPLLAFLVTISLPVRAAVVGQYALALLPATLLVLVLRRPDFRRFLALWSSAALLILWRPLLGWPALISVLIVVVAVILLERRELLSPAAAALGVVIGILPVVLVVAEMIGSWDTLEALRALIGSVGESGSRGFGAILTTTGTLGLVHFMERLLPVMAVAGLLFYGVRKLMAAGAFSPSSHAVLYLVVFSLLVPARLETGEVRDLFDPSLLLLMLALLPFLVFRGSYRTWMSGRSSWLIVTLVLCALLGKIDFYHLAGEKTVHRPRGWQPGERRVHFNQGPHRDLVELLQRELEKGETFLDFTNSPVLYSLAGMRIPFRGIPDYRSTSESLQRSQITILEDYRERRGLPLVVMQAPQGVSGVRHHLSVATTSYRIAEYLNRNYLPFARVSGWEIWRERGVRRNNPDPPARILNPSAVSQHFWLGSLPYRWAKGDPWQAGFQTDLVESLLEEPAVVRPGVPLSLTWETTVVAEEGHYLQVRARSLKELALGKKGPVDSTLTVTYGQPTASSFDFTLAPWLSQESSSEQPLKLPLRDNPKFHHLERSETESERLVFRTDGSDSWVRRFVDPTLARRLDPGEALWLRMDYRSSREGTGQVYFAAKDRHFREPASVRVPLIATRGQEEVQQFIVPVVGIEAGQRLVDVRFDPPDGTEFEIVGVDLIRRQRVLDDYLVRLSTQWRWFSDDNQQLTLQSNSPVLVDSVNLRTAD